MLTVLSVTTSPCADFWSALSAAHAAADIAGMSITNAPVESANRTNVAVPSASAVGSAAGAVIVNVRPLMLEATSTDRDTALQMAEARLKSKGALSSGDLYAITCGEPMGAPGGTNMLKICRVG